MLLVAPDVCAQWPPSVGGNEGEIDIVADFAGAFGDIQPTERETTFQDADIKTFRIGAGYTIGELGPLSSFHVRLDGGYFIAGAERIDNPEDELFGTDMHAEDKGGYVTGSLSTHFVKEERFTFGGYFSGTIPVDVRLEKFSSLRLHFVSGGTTAHLFLTDTTKLVSLSLFNRTFVGSGAYSETGQHNAAVGLDTYFALEFDRWLLPWRVGLYVGPELSADLNENVNRAYHDNYARLDPDLVAGDRIQMMRFGIGVFPYFRITDHAALELGLSQTIIGIDVPSTQTWRGGIRIAF